MTMMVLMSAASAAGAETIKVDATGIAFAPQKITAHVGDRIEWINKDFVAHTATAKTGDNWDIQLAPDKTGGVTLQKAGHIDYYCKVHPNMTGEIDVK
jgi:plastocyanin